MTELEMNYITNLRVYAPPSNDFSYDIVDFADEYSSEDFESIESFVETVPRHIATKKKRISSGGVALPREQRRKLRGKKRRVKRWKVGLQRRCGQKMRKGRQCRRSAKLKKRSRKRKQWSSW